MLSKGIKKKRRKGNVYTRNGESARESGVELKTVEEGESGLQWRERWAEVNY